MKNVKMIQQGFVGKMTAVAVLLAASWSAQAAPISLDLTGITSSGMIGQATYSRTTQQSTGTGVIDPFVQVGGANMDVVQGYNTTTNGTYENGSSPVHNHEITVGQIGFLDTNGADPGGFVMRFLLDINQDNGKKPGDSLLSLDEVQIFISKTPNQGVENALGQGDLVALGLSALVYQMDDGDDNRVKLDYALNSGSGSGDMFLDIPIELFDPAFTALGMSNSDDKNGAYIYLFSRFGEHNPNNDGFEEWAAMHGGALPPDCTEDCTPVPPTDIPEPVPLALLGLGFGAIALARRRRA